jgi:hypothetical protein
MKTQVSPESLFEQIDAVWNAARGERILPRRSDIDPAKLGALLPFVSVIDVVAGDPTDFRYRVVGEQLIRGLGKNITGGLHTQHANPEAPEWPFYRAYLRCIESKTPQSIDHSFRNRNETPVTTRARVWPLSEDGVTVDALIGGCVFLTPGFA